MRSDITPGQTSDYLGFDLVMADNLPEPSSLLADTPKTETPGFCPEMPIAKSPELTAMRAAAPKCSLL